MAEGDIDCAGIGCGYRSADVGDILIEGGTVAATSQGGSAAIGGSYDTSIESGTVTINGGTVNANVRLSEAINELRHESGAAIGSGGNSNANMDITITGGTVKADVDKSSFNAGAAIGAGGYDSKGGDFSVTITITGGKVTAIGHDGAAAIGAGKVKFLAGGECTGTISITGGTVRLCNNTTEEQPEELYIGHGYGGEDDGTLILGDNMKVQKRNPNDTDGEDVPQAKRIATCRSVHSDSKYIYIMPSDDIGANLYGHSLSLEGDIGVNFYMELADSVIAHSDTAYIRFTTPSGADTETKTVLVKEAVQKMLNGKTYYVFKCNVSAKDMASEITAQMFDGDKAGIKYTYSVKDYADYLLAHTNGSEEYAKAAPLVKAMLNYGANSQSYFGAGGTLANAGLDAGDKTLGEVSIPDTFKYTDHAALPESITFEGATLSLKSETTLSLYFKRLPDDTVFTCSGKTVETAKNGAYVIARIRGIRAAELENDFTVTFTDGSVTYNAMTY